MSDLSITDAKHSEKIVEEIRCPHCLSSDVWVDYSNLAKLWNGIINTYRCNNCGYTSTFFPIISEPSVELIENLNQKVPLEDITVYSNINAFWKYWSVFLLIIFLTSVIRAPSFDLKLFFAALLPIPIVLLIIVHGQNILAKVLWLRIVIMISLITIVSIAGDIIIFHTF